MVHDILRSQCAIELLVELRDDNKAMVDQLGTFTGFDKAPGGEVCSR